MTISWLPELLAEIAEVAGLDAALRLAELHGGTRKHIPAHVRGDDHWLVAAVGRPAAEAICRHFRQLSASDTFRGVYVLIPNGPTGTIAAAKRRMAAALAHGASASEAARAAGMHERSAYRAKTKKKHGSGGGTQGELF